ncbi:MAG: FtsX-like permease family protein [Planctomycetota bacterium]|nr:FtsX-like permease family protein [Planctomycetota bacterium]
MKLLRLVLKNLLRRKGRTVLTIGGIGSALLLFVLVESLSLGLDRALSGTDAAKTLVVYRKNRYCPQTSNLPDVYLSRIEDVQGVESVLPVQIFLNNCRASLDLVTFQGAPVERMLASRNLTILEGSEARFREEQDAALVGVNFAKRRGVSVGEQFKFGGIDVKVAGIFESSEQAEESLILTHLDFLRYAMPMRRDGSVTQYEVKVTDPSRAKEIAAEIDALFVTAEQPTDTRPQVAHLERATKDLSTILGFGRWLGLGCVVVVLSLVANTVFMSVQERVKEFGVFRTLGFRETHIGGLVVVEAIVLALLGAVFGLGAAFGILQASHLTIGSEGVSVAFATSPALIVRGLVVALSVGVIAGLIPAVRSARQPIVQSLRS